MGLYLYMKKEVRGQRLGNVGPNVDVKIEKRKSQTKLTYKNGNY